MGALHQILLGLGGTAAGVGLPVSDDFNRADNASSLGTATSGHVWTALGGTWGISSNKAHISNATGLKPAYVECGAADVSVQATLNKTDASNNLNRIGIAFRISDASNFLYAYYLTSTGLRLFKLVAGVNTQIGTATVTGTNNDVLKVVTSGDQIEVYQNGVLKIGPITETHNQTATKHGLFFEVGGSSFTLCRWDDFSIV